MSAMTSSDLILRGGLLISVSILLGIFGGSLVERTTGSVDMSMEDLAEGIGSLIQGVLGSEPGSRVTLSFGISSSYDDGVVELPGRIGNDNFKLKVLPGLMLLEWDGKRATVIEDRGILPIHPSVNERSLTFEQARTIGRKSGGYTLSTPVSITVESRVLSGNDTVFIHPNLDQTGPLNELLFLENSIFQISPDFHEEVLFNEEDEVLLLSDRVLIWKGDAIITSKGYCPVPFILPSGTEVSGPIDQVNGSFRIVREAVNVSNDLYEDSWKVEL